MTFALNSLRSIATTSNASVTSILFARQDRKSRILQIARAVDGHLGILAQVQRASTDANVPISLGREAIAIGAGGHGGGAHTLQEWFDPKDRELGLERILLLVLALAANGEAGVAR